MNTLSMKPFWLQISGTPDKNLSNLFDGKVLREFVQQHRIVLLRGFASIHRNELIDYAKTIGSLLQWEFGNVMEMQAHEKPTNYLFTHGHVPLHWDGAFHQVPRFLLFNCIQAPLANSGGETFFSNTNKIWLDANKDEKKLWENYKLTYTTEKLAHYGGTITSPLVQQHPDKNEMILRFAEPVLPPMLNPVSVSMNHVNEKQFIQVMSTRCNDAKYCYVHTWQENDFLLADNHALLHGRNAFKNFSPRHLRRIQIL